MAQWNKIQKTYIQLTLTGCAPGCILGLLLPGAAQRIFKAHHNQVANGPTITVVLKVREHLHCLNIN